MLPDSIKTDFTNALYSVFNDRLKQLNIESLKIDPQNEKDIYKLDLWLQMFGIPREILPSDLSAISLRAFLQKIQTITRQAGTPRSVELLCEAIGASKATIKYEYVNRHNSESRYNSQQKYDAGAQYKKFAITVEVSGVESSRRDWYKTTLEKMFLLFIPARIYLEVLTFI
ncbi:MAG: hypothetical protein N4A72_14750 [Bacteroidales bacterium]|jgi:hypothetical protein|nr:hypothetical protein [Bacteroidales bacterium]